MNKKIEILKATGMSNHDAKRHMKEGATIYEANDYIANFEQYASGLEEEDKETLLNFLKAGKRGSIWGNDLIEYDGIKYYIEYAL